MVSFGRKLWQKGRELLPAEGFHFGRPLVLLQSDDWGRAGLRDQEGLEQLRSSGLTLGERPYDFYTLETAEDLAALNATLAGHRDSGGNHPALEMNFLLFNLDFDQVAAGGFREIHVLALSDGLPKGWRRPGLIEGYRAGIAEAVFHPAVHGTTHFCRAAVERHLSVDGERAARMRTLWQAGTPYIHWRMPWIGYEYWDAEKPENERFLPAEVQRELIGAAVGEFARMFSRLSRSACAPGYRANEDTHRAWGQHGIRVAQNGPGDNLPPHFDRHGVLQLSRNVEFEPATDEAFSVEACVRQAEACFERGLPAIVSVHSINFHSTVRDFRSRTLAGLDEFLSALEAKHADLLYLHGENLWEVIGKGSYRGQGGLNEVKVISKTFSRALWSRQ